MNNDRILGMLSNPERSLIQSVRVAEQAGIDGRCLAYQFGILTAAIKTALTDIETMKEIITEDSNARG